jgi:transcriptional regulator
VDPRAIAVDRDGRLYICERGGHALRVVDPNGTIRTIAGTGTAGASGDGGPALSAQLNGPKHIFVEKNGDVLIADTENHVIRRYLPRTGRIERVAGTGVQGVGGLGGPPELCPLNRPHGAVVHPRTGELYIADSENHRILRVRSLRPLHGYGVLLRIRQISGEALEIPQGSLYPALYRLEHKGLLATAWGQSDNNRRAKYHTLTAAGRRRLREETAGWNRLATAMAAALDAVPDEV